MENLDPFSGAIVSAIALFFTLHEQFERFFGKPSDAIPRSSAIIITDAEIPAVPAPRNRRSWCSAGALAAVSFSLLTMVRVSGDGIVEWIGGLLALLAIAAAGAGTGCLLGTRAADTFQTPRSMFLLGAVATTVILSTLRAIVR